MRKSWPMAVNLWQHIPVSPDKLAWLIVWCGILLCSCCLLLLCSSFKKQSPAQPEPGSETSAARPRLLPVPLSPEASAQARARWQRAANAVHRGLFHRRLWSAYGNFLQLPAQRALWQGLERRNGELIRIRDDKGNKVRPSRHRPTAWTIPARSIPKFPMPRAVPQASRRQATQ